VVDSQPINVVRIHGTFSPNPEWFDKTSLLSKTLLVHFPNAQLIPFNWSGHNSHSERINAGSRLSKYLRDLRTDDPSRPCFVITHSHGGMVLLYALSQKSTQESIDGCVFLGTPFLRTRRRSLGEYIDTLSFQLTWLSLYIPPTVLLVLWFGFDGLLVSIAVLFFAILFAARPWFERNITNRISGALLRTLSKRQEAFWKYVTPASLNLPALICYAPYDEARMWLSFLNSVTGSTFTGTAYVVEFLSYWPIFIIIWLIGGAIDWLVGERNEFVIGGLLPLSALLLAGMLLIVVLSVVMPVISAMVRGHLAGFGWEGLFGYSLVEVWPSDYPMSDPEANVLVL
jgi:pimeloyl-ACP methyl ester carboxylesterase